MSIGREGVRFDKTKAQKSLAWFLALTVLEGVFSFFLYISLSARIFEVQPSHSAAGVPLMLSYQGRLTDTGGNVLGGTGTTYCFRYAIYDALSGGSKIWPSGTPTNSTATVTSGIFNDQIGRMDALTYDFFSTSTVYLDVQANTVTSTCGGTWESMVPRQQILSSGFAITSQSIYGSVLRTPTSTKVQVGTGAGVPSGQVLLSLDVKNNSDTLGAACTDNGSLWYNSVNTRALLCENGTIQVISNPTSTISGIKEQGTSTAISAGTVNFSASTNITISQTGNTLQFSVPFATLSQWPQHAWGIWSTAASTLYSGSTSANGASTHSTMSYYVMPLALPSPIAFSKVQVIQSFATAAGTGSATNRYYMGIYTMNAGTLSLSTSWIAGYVRSQNSISAQTFSVWTGSASNSIISSQGNVSSFIQGVKVFPVYQGGNITFTAGQYYMIHALHSNTAGAAVGAQSYGVGGQNSYIEFAQNTSATSRWVPLMGVFSSTSSTNAAGANQWLMPSSLNSTNISNASITHIRNMVIMFRGN